jgi:LacI family transcriptional regulator
MATLKHIAAELGLSPATVSRALNGFPEVNARTRARVEELARAMNYRPNQIAQKLVSGRSGMIGMVLRSAIDMSCDPSFYDVMSGLSNRLADYDMDLVFHASSSDDPVAPYRRLVAKNTLDGFILNAPAEDDPRIAFLQAQRVPFVMHGRTACGPLDYPYYDIDNVRLAADSVALLHDLGHRRIALLNGPAGYAYAAQRLSGFRAALAARGLTLPDRFAAHDRPAEDYGYRTALAMLADGTPPTALVCASTLVAAGAMRAAAHLGLVIPQDVSLIAHDDALPDVRAVNFAPALTVTRSPLRDACAPLTDMMVRLLDGSPAVSLQTIVTAELIVRNSTGPVPKGGDRPWQ